MTVRLESTIKRFIGLSVDAKPNGLGDDGVFRSVNLPPGSSFLEEDTGRIYRWNGEIWVFPMTEDEVPSLLSGILSELQTIRELQETTVATL